MARKFKSINEAVIDFLRDELEKRYEYANLKRFAEFKEIDPKIVDAFRTFALRRIYPIGETRTEIDAAFDHLSEILTSPKKIKALGVAILPIVWKLGRKLPVALLAGQRTINAFHCASKVEALLVEGVKQAGLDWSKGLDSATVGKALEGLPREPFENLIESLVLLLQSASDRQILDAGFDLLQQIHKVMQSDHANWSEVDLAGVKLALTTLKEARELFPLLTDKDVIRLIRGIEEVEKAWFESL
jgi:hypothetical protein